MPELPEVEVSRMGISPHLVDQVIERIDVRQPQLRWPVPKALQQLHGVKINAVRRRAKYLLLDTALGSVVIHLGMSGSLRILPRTKLADKHDHVDLHLTNGKVLRYNDPRRFGSWLWCKRGESLSVLDNCGPEPLTDEFNADYMQQKALNKKVAVKNFIMNNQVVVGVGNIYANEALFQTRIHPLRAAGKVTSKEWQHLVNNIKQVLTAAIAQGGTTLKDFAQTDGKPGYFAQELQVYGKAGQPCPNCTALLSSQMIGQRNTFFCQDCQQ